MTTGQHRLAQVMRERVPVDIGTTSLTALRRAALPDRSVSSVGHPVYETVPLSSADCRALGSDFQRLGFVWPVEEGRGEEFRDSYGVDWLRIDGNMAPYGHPLEHVAWKELSLHVPPALPERIQVHDVASDASTILDPPCYGLVDTCFMLRNGWQFLNDLIDNYRVANALLDWAMDVIERAYMAALDALPSDPDIIVYGDDLGFETGMYLSDLDFRTFIFPRLLALFTRLRRRSRALICFHSCGAIRSILGDICELGVDVLNLDFYAKNMHLPEVRQQLPRDMILHAPVNLEAIGQAVRNRNPASLAILTADLAQSMPCIAGPIDNISEPQCVRDNLVGNAFVRALTVDDLRRIREVGPVKSIIDKAVFAASRAPVPVLAPSDIPLAPINGAKLPHDPATRQERATHTKSATRQGRY